MNDDITENNVYTELAKLIENGYYDYPEQAGLAIQVLNDSLRNGDTPKMAFAFAKNLDVRSEF